MNVRCKPFKKIVSLFVFSCSLVGVHTAEPAPQPIDITFLSSQLNNLATHLSYKKEELFDDLDFTSSKGIDLEITLFNNRITARYKARWGYKGAGKADTPFTGFTGSFTIPITLAKGLIIDPLQADRLQKMIQDFNFDRFITVSPSDEFRLKLFQLFLSASNNEHTATSFAQQLKILLSRVAVTPEFDGAYLFGIRLVGTKKHPGYLDAVAALPDEQFEDTCQWFTRFAKMVAPLFGLGDKPFDLSFLTRFLGNIDYPHATELELITKDTVSATILFGYRGAGMIAAPLQGCRLEVKLPFASMLNNVATKVGQDTALLQLPSHVTVPLGPTAECLLKMFMVLSSASNGTLPAHTVPEELESLLHRLLITEKNVSDFTLRLGSLQVKLIGTAQQPGLLRILGMHARKIMTYDFAAARTKPLQGTDSIIFLLALTYKTYVDATLCYAQAHKALLATVEGQKLVQQLTDAKVHATQSGEHKHKFAVRRVEQKLRSALFTQGKDSFQALLDFVVTELALAARRVPLFFMIKEQLNSMPLLRDLHEHGIEINFSRFWQELGTDRK